VKSTPVFVLCLFLILCGALFVLVERSRVEYRKRVSLWRTEVKPGQERLLLNVPLDTLCTRCKHPAYTHAPRYPSVCRYPWNTPLKRKSVARCTCVGFEPFPNPPPE
jgi:hypothetical protein